MKHLFTVTGLTLIFSALAAVPSYAQEAEIVLTEPEIESPVSFTEDQVEEFRKRLADLKGERGEIESDEFDADTALTSLLETLTASRKTLEVAISADPDFFNPPEAPLLIGGAPLGETDKIFIDEQAPVSIDIKGPFAGPPTPLAIDEPTSTALNLPLDVSAQIMVPVTILQPKKQKACLKLSTADVPRGQVRPCEKEVEVFEEVKAVIDPRLALDRFNGEISYEGLTGAADASRFHATRAGDVSVVFAYSSGVELEFTSSEDSVREFLTGGRATGRTESLKTLKAVKFEKFGLPGVDIEGSDIEAAAFDHFVSAQKQSQFGTLTMASAARPPIPKPIIAYNDGTGGTKFDGLDVFSKRGGRAFSASAEYKARTSVKARVKGFGPLDDKLKIADHALPGKSDVEWTLNGAFPVTHSFTLTRVSADINGAIGGTEVKPEFFPGREYELRILFDGPVPLNYPTGYQLNFGGNVDWAGSETVEATDTNTVITRKFFPGTQDETHVEVSLNGAAGEIFTYKAELDTAPAAVAAMEQNFKRGFVRASDTIEKSENLTMDSFFPSTQPPTPANVTIGLNFLGDDGAVLDFSETVGDALGELAFRRIDQSNILGAVAQASKNLPNDMFLATDEEFLVRTNIDSAKGRASFQVKPEIGAAQIESFLTGGAGGILRVVTGGDEELEAEPITVTSNALRLIRGAEGFTLIISGEADMSRYSALWTPKGASSARERSFSREEGADYSSFFRSGDPLEKVEIVEKTNPSEIIATLLGVQATPVPKILILPFRTVAAQVNESDLEFADAATLNASEASCLEANRASLGERGAVDKCAQDRDAQKDQIDQNRDAQKDANEFIDTIEDADKRLVELVDTMEVAAAVQGAPAAILGDTVCEWTLVKNAQSLTLNERVTRLLRDASRGDFCFNVVNNIKQGFSPEAELRVELKILEKGQAFRAFEPPLRRADGLNVAQNQSDNAQNETNEFSSEPGSR